MRYHIAPMLIAFNKVLAHIRNSSKPYPQNDEIKIVDHAQGPGRGFSAVPMRFEVSCVALKVVSVDQLRVVRFGGPARQAANVDQRCVFFSASDFRLDVELEGFDIMALSFRKLRGIRQCYFFQAMEKSESYPARFQHLIHWRKDCISHAGMHLPEDSAARAEQH